MPLPRWLLLTAAAAALAALAPGAEAALFSRAAQTPEYGGLLDAATGIQFAGLWEREREREAIDTMKTRGKGLIFSRFFFFHPSF